MNNCREYCAFDSVANDSRRSRELSKATLDDCRNLGLDLRYLFNPDKALQLPSRVVKCQPSDDLCAALRLADRTLSSLGNEASRCATIELLLREAADYSNGSLVVASESAMNCETTDAKYRGRADYTIQTHLQESHLIVIEAKGRLLSHDAIYQTLAVAACLLKTRRNEGKYTPVFAVLTNGTFFRFFVIDVDGQVSSSRERVLDLRAAVPSKKMSLPSRSFTGLIGSSALYYLVIFQTRKERINR